MTKKTFFIQGALLTLISLFLRVANMGYRSYLSQKIGPEGMGLYQLIFSIFLLTVTLSTSGISLAVTRMVTAALAGGRPQTVRSVVARCFGFCLCISLGIALCLFFLAGFAASFFLGNPAAAPCLRILGLGLPFMSLCTCMKGYFLAVDESLNTALSDALEQVLTIGATVFFFWRQAPAGIEQACLWAMAASTLGEAASFLTSWGAYRRSLRRNTPAQKEKSQGVLRGLGHIALPCTLSSAARSLLNTGENLLIPRELQKFGLGYDQALSQYGLLQGMAMPMLYFPSSFLTSFASLLIPKIARERELSHKKAVAYISGRAVQAALAFGIFFAALFAAFGDSWGSAFYHSGSAGAYLRVLAPLVPLTYLDVVVDSLLKGMDEQFNSMKYNFADSFIRVILVLCVLRFSGMESYVGILFFSTIFNASLSLHRLMKVSHLRISLPRHILMPLGSAALGVFLAGRALQQAGGLEGFGLVFFQTLLSGGIFASCYIPLGRWMDRRAEKMQPCRGMGKRGGSGVSRFSAKP
ncbi:oligosaccharide flippase family protein [Acutalibacter sp.]|uniref:oligosaccharide flippase family protein n=1 Tax=Acutalibacter sp. TaxID=1918636 RepID=UPI00216F0B7C|nr:polysaccharide biosynthesis protein [Acutalibacter sp.]